MLPITKYTRIRTEPLNLRLVTTSTFLDELI